MNKIKFNYYEIPGYFGAFFLTISLIPQVYMTFKTKKVNDISIYFLILQLLTCISFIIYGIFILSLPILIANSCTFILTSLLLVAKYLYK